MDLLRKVGSGSCADVYRFDDVCVKVYKDLLDVLSDQEMFRIKDTVFDILKDIDSPVFLNLLEYDKDYRDLIVVYSYEYVQDISKKLVDLCTQYSIYSLEYMDKFADILTDNDIYAFDPNSDNLIVGPDGLVIIDPDLYRFNNNRIVDLKVYNKKVMLKYLYNKLASELNIPYGVPYSRLNNVFDFDVNNDTELALEVQRRMKVLTPRDIIR